MFEFLKSWMRNFFSSFLITIIAMLMIVAIIVVGYGLFTLLATYFGITASTATIGILLGCGLISLFVTLIER